MKYYIKKIGDFSPEKENEFLQYLDKEKLNEYKSAANESRKKSILFSQGFAKETICEIYGIEKNDLIFSVSESGKPYCKSHKKIKFSLSHSADTIALAIDEKDVGIDIEKIRKADEKLVERVCTENEKNIIFSSKNPDKKFTEIWTKKEAYLKALGTGIDRELKKLDVENENLKFTTFSFEGFIVSVFSL